MAVSKAPSGLTVTRTGRTFVLSWKQGETYESQICKYTVAWSFLPDGTPKWQTEVVNVKGKKETWRKWINKPVGPKATSASVTFTDPNWGIAAIGFFVQGKAPGKSISSLSKINYVITVPNAPNMGMSVVAENQSTFSWSTPFDNKTNRHLVKTQWQHALSVNSNTDNGDTINGWSSINESFIPGVEGTLEGSWTHQETGFNTVANSYTRWVRARSVGWAGLLSSWRYARRVYAHPNAAKNISAVRSAYGSSGYSVAVSWNSPASSARPIDSIVINYAKESPVVEVTQPSTIDGTVTMRMLPPIISSWTSVIDTGGIANKRNAAFIDANDIPNDSCFYLQIVNKHDTRETPSETVLASNGIGKLVPPAAPIATADSQDPGLYSITLGSYSGRGTSIDNAGIAIYCRFSSKQDEFKCIGVIGPGSYELGATRIPPIPEGDTIAFGAQAFIGNYTPKQASDTTNYTPFTVSMLMSSDITWSPELPLPPEVVVEPKNETTIHVTWNQSWTDATQAELSWSEHEDAWESTNEPSVYIVRSINAGSWNISGLSVGTYYVRVRLMKTEGENTSYSAYSTTKVVKLASSPDIPSLLLSSGVISKTGSVTCYWAYISGDGTGQRQAEIFEAFPEYEAVSSPSGNPYENGYYEKVNDTTYTRSLDTEVVSGKTYYLSTSNITYGTEALAKTDSAQKITLLAEDFRWKPGETHNLVVRVMSMSGESSAGFSSPVPVTIADELSINIESSSLEYVNIPSEYDSEGTPIEYRSVFSMQDFPLSFTVNGFGVGDRLICIIDRSAPYMVDRPDESRYEGFIGETVLMKEYDTASINIEREDLIGSLDDGAAYKVTIIRNDSYGQNVQTSEIPTGTYSIAQLPDPVYIAVDDPSGDPSENGYYELINDEYVLSEDTGVDPNKTYYLRVIDVNPKDKGYYELAEGEYILTTDISVVDGKSYYTKDYTDSFEVHWTHQAVMPSATIEIDSENNITKITPIRPDEGYLNGDLVDIYRLSADPPELIYTGAILDPQTTYVDPYPAFGEFGGHRIVYRTFNGDYITEDNQLAMVDYLSGDNPNYKHDKFGIVIDFGGNQMILPGNVSFSSKWSKDFSLTKYLGGSVQGDWNSAVERSMTAKVTIPVEYEKENAELIRRLSVYSGICHVRTPDGSSFAANIEVNEDREEKWTTQLAKISLDITKCDPEGYDGMTLADWNAQQ